MLIPAVWLSVCFCGCNPAGSDVPPDLGGGAALQVERCLSLATGEISGTYNRVGSMLASLWSHPTENVRVITQATGGSMANLTMLSRGEVDLALAASNSAYRAYSGSPPFRQPVKQLRAVASLYPEVFHFIVTRESPLSRVSEIRGLRVAVGSKLGGTHLTAREVFEAHGIAPEDIQTEYLSFSEAVFALQAGMVDVVVIGAGIPTRAVEDAAAMTDIKLLEVDPEKIQAFIDSQPYISYHRIPAGTYRGIDRDVLTIASPALLVTTTAMPEGLVYRLLTVLFNSSAILAGSAYTKGVSLETATKCLSIPLHDGARRYYHDAGVLE